MKSLILVLLFSFSMAFVYSQGESNFSMISKMDGEIFLDGGGSTNVWGYKLEGPGVTTIPAPLLEVMAGDSVHVQFSNQSPESHTIHWHGLDVNQLNDGVPTTSFYVVTGETVDYSFHAPLPGTYLYHCHVTTTIHLTMGMYGMFVVKYPGDLLYEDGPGYNKELQYLASDLEVEANDAPTEAYPFHQIRPDYFMVNGLSGMTLADNPGQTVKAYIGDSIALRLGSMAYTKVKFIFPEGSNPTTHLSDGRVLPEVLTNDTLVLYPGERYTAILHPDEFLEDNIIVEYYNMINKQLEGTNEISVINLGEPESIAEYRSPLSFSIFPNPVLDQITIESDKKERFQILTIQGEVVDQMLCQKGQNIIEGITLAQGMYFLRSESGESLKFVKN